MLRQKHLKVTKEKKKEKNINSSSRVSLQYHSVGLILILIGLKKLLSHVNLNYIRKSIKSMMKHKIKIHFKCL